MKPVCDVAAIRRAEERLMARLPDGALMQRASFGLAVQCANVIDRSVLPGSTVVILVGAGNNGGDALWAGSFLAGRGCRVDAMLLSDSVHAEGLAALQAAGGRVHHSLDTDLIVNADLVLDGIVGIGGSGPLRTPELVDLLRDCVGVVVAVDSPSGVDCDTGAADLAAAVPADVTVTFGALKPGLLIAPGKACVGELAFVDIGLELDDEPIAWVMEPIDVALRLPTPREFDYKYSRGVVGIAAGSARYLGAALLCTQAAAAADIGMVMFLDRNDGVAESVVTAMPTVVATTIDPIDNERADAWVVGPGLGDDVAALIAVLRTARSVVVDADAIRMCSRTEIKELLSDRADRGRITVMTPHDGEFAALGFSADSDRLSAAKQAAAELAVVMVLKGPGTIIAGPDGTTVIDTEGTSALSTAGSGDVLSGLIGALLAANQPASITDAVVDVGAAVFSHGRAGRVAAGSSATVNAMDLVGAIPEAIAGLRL